MALLLNCSLLTYTLLAYGLGIGLLVQLPWILNLLGALLLLHGLVLSALATHELIHSNLFKQHWANGVAGRLMTHLNGACYAPYADLVQHHLNHHIHHADFVPFEMGAFFAALPPWLRRVCVALEWAYFPWLEFWLRWRLMVAAFTNPEKAPFRGHTVLLLLYRGGLFALLGWVSPKALVLYGLVYVAFVNLMRFADAFHHTYDYVVMGAEFPKRDRVYEQTHTFSNVVSKRYAWLNLLYLNFGYHNAHHHDMRCPWHQLPQLHQRLYGDEAKQLLPLPQLVSNYHRFRLDRLFGGQSQVAAAAMAEMKDGCLDFTGGIGVSLLTPP